MTNLKALLVMILGQMFTKRLSMSQKKLSSNLVIGYTSFIIKHQKHGIKASKVIISYFEKASKVFLISPLDKCILLSFQREVKRIFQNRMNNQMVQDLEFLKAIKYIQRAVYTQ